MRLIATIFAALLFSLGGQSTHAEEMRSVDVRFSAGATGTTLSDTIVGYDSVLFRVGAQAGQTMSVRLRPSNLATYFNLYEPGRGPGDEALASGQFTDPLNEWSDILPASGEYTISVFMMRSAARRNEQSDFDIDISVTGATGDRVEGDFADGLAGGPDFYEVAVSGGGSLNMRAEPSTGSGVVGQLSGGQNVRNLGCRMAEGRRWCRVATLADPGTEGWVVGDFLVEGSGVSSESVSSPTGTDVRVQFASGTSGAELTGSLAPGDTRLYLIGARSGQNLYVRVAPQGAPISYQIFNPDETFLLDQISSELEYRGELWQSGDHVIEVINRTNGTASYNIIIGIE